MLHENDHHLGPSSWTPIYNNCYNNLISTWVFVILKPKKAADILQYATNGSLAKLMAEKCVQKFNTDEAASDSGGGGGVGYFRNLWVGMCRWDPGTLNLYQS